MHRKAIHPNLNSLIYTFLLLFFVFFCFFDHPHLTHSSLNHSVASVGVFGLRAGYREKLNESHSHTFHSLASEFTTRTVRGSEQRLHASHTIKNSAVQQGHNVFYVTGVALKSAVTFQRQLSSLIYLLASCVCVSLSLCFNSAQPLASILGITSTVFQEHV